MATLKSSIYVHIMLWRYKAGKNPIFGLPMYSTDGSTIQICRATRPDVLVHTNKTGTPDSHPWPSYWNYSGTSPWMHQAIARYTGRCISHKISDHERASIDIRNESSRSSAVENLSLRSAYDTHKKTHFCGYGHVGSIYQRNFILLRWFL